MSDLDSEFYDLERARNKLTKISEDCIDFSAETGQGVQLTNANLSQLFVQKYESPSSWRLTRFDEASGENEVVEFRVQGVISDKLLPPIGNVQTNKATKQCFHLRQAVSITGLGSSAFGNIVPTIVQIFSMFLPLFPRDTLDLWEADDAKGYEAISTHTRLFTSRSQASDAEPIPFDPLVDSNHNLTRLGKLASGKFIHTSDNEVEYLGPINGAGGNRTGNVSPEVFRVGDIVELSVSFVVWPWGRDKYRMGIQLKSIRLLDSEETNNARLKTMIESSQRKTVKFAVPKRKKTYTKEEEMAEAQFKLSKMSIEQGHTRHDTYDRASFLSR